MHIYTKTVLQSDIFGTTWMVKNSPKFFSQNFFHISFVKSKRGSLEILKKQKSFQETQISFPNDIEP